MTWPRGGNVMQPRPFPLQPLLDELGITRGTYAARWNVGGRDLKVLRDQGLTEYQADAYAMREGLHPGDVWPDEWWGVGE